jgi:TIR domain/Cyclic nucleotide-binding domain
VRFHDQSDVELPYFGAQQVSVMSVSGEFESIGLPVAATNDRLALERALERPGAALEALYRAKRLLQVDPEDRQALDALLTLAERRDLVAAGGEVADLVLDRDFGGEFTRQAQLVERRQGDLICREDDRGTTMFLVLRGEVGGFASASGGEQTPIAAPDFRIAPGALVGELAFALKRPRTATLWCLQDSALLAFSHSELINASPDPQVRKELEEAVNRTIRARVVEYVGRTVPYLAGPGGPLRESDATWAKLRRGSRLISRQWREEPVLTPDDEAIAAPGVYVLIRGVLESGTVRLDGTKQPLVYADLPGDLTWRRGRYTLGDDVMLLAIASDVLRDFGAQTYREIVARVRAELEANAGVEGGPARRQPGPVFVSYSHRDASWLELLRTHLEPYARDGALDVWSDEGIPTGSRWLDEIEAALRATRVAVLLVTPHFLASRFIAERELPPILDAAEREGLRVVWIPVSHSSYERTPIRHYQAAHDPSRPLDSLRPAERNKALVEICRRIGEATAAVA